MTFFCFVQCIIKQLLDSPFVISRIIKVEVGVISRSRCNLIIETYSELIVIDIFLIRLKNTNCGKSSITNPHVRNC